VTAVSTKLEIIYSITNRLARLKFSSPAYTTAVADTSALSAATVGMIICLPNNSFCVTARNALSGARFDLNNINGAPIEYVLPARSNFVNYQPVTNYIVTIYLTPSIMMIFDSTDLDGNPIIAQINVGTNGTGVAAAFSVPCYLAGT